MSRTAISAALLLFLPLTVLPAACGDRGKDRDALRADDSARGLDLALQGDTATATFKDTALASTPTAQPTPEETPPQPAPAPRPRPYARPRYTPPPRPRPQPREQIEAPAPVGGGTRSDRGPLGPVVVATRGSWHLRCPLRGR